MQKKVDLTFLVFCILQILLYGNHYFQRNIKYWVYASIGYMIMMISQDCYEIFKTGLKDKELLHHPNDALWLICSILWLFAFIDGGNSNLIHLNLCVGFFMVWISRIYDHHIPNEISVDKKEEVILDLEKADWQND